MKPRVLIFGLLDSQAAHMKREFGARLDLRALEGSRVTGLGTAAAAADYVLLMTGFVPHKAGGALRKAGVKPVLVHGGMTHLRAALAEVSQRCAAS